MGSYAKILTGTLMLIAGIYWYLAESVPLIGGVMAQSGLVPLWRAALFMFAGAFGGILVLIGLFLLATVESQWKKIVSGFIAMALGIFWYTTESIPLVTPALSNVGSLVPLWKALVAMFAGGFGAVLILAGIFVVWAEADDMRAEKEFGI